MSEPQDKFTRFKKWLESEIKNKEKAVDEIKAQLSTLYEIRAATFSFSKE